MIPGFFMLTQNQIKHITALKVKKYREEFSQFIAEGNRLVMDLVHSEFVVAGIYGSADWIDTNLQIIEKKRIPVFETLTREMKRISALSTPSPVLAVVNIPDVSESSGIIDQILKSPNPQIPELILSLDDIRDPGNLGTIIRIADWFGISTLLCSNTCVDHYNPKVVQATMGSIARVKVIRCKLPVTLTSLSGLSGSLPIYGACLEGESIFSQTLTDHGIILIGNESRGISPDIAPFITQKLFIPSFGNSTIGKAESLNAAVATAIICSEFRRKSIKTPKI
jgi:TrmH family RNA methyltransferase